MSDKKADKLYIATRLKIIRKTLEVDYNVGIEQLQKFIKELEEADDLPPPRKKKKIELIITDDISHTCLTEEDYRILEDYMDPKLNEETPTEFLKELEDDENEC